MTEIPTCTLYASPKHFLDARCGKSAAVKYTSPPDRNDVRLIVYMCQEHYDKSRVANPANTVLLDQEKIIGFIDLVNEPPKYSDFTPGEKLNHLLEEMLAQHFDKQTLLTMVIGKVNPQLAGKKLMNLLRKLQETA